MSAGGRSGCRNTPARSLRGDGGLAQPGRSLLTRCFLAEKVAVGGRGSGTVDVHLAEILVHHETPPVVTHRDSGRKHVLSRPVLARTAADGQEQLPFGGKYLEIAKRGVHDIDIPGRVHGHFLGAGKLPALAANGAEYADQRAVGAEFLHPEIAAVDDVYRVVGGDRYVPRQIK